MTPVSDARIASASILLSVILETAGLALIKTTLAGKLVQGWEIPVHLVTSVPGMAGVALFFLAPLLFLMGLSRIEISSAYPLKVGATLIIIQIGGTLFLGERLTYTRLIGILLIIFSHVLLYSDARPAGEET